MSETTETEQAAAGLDWRPWAVEPDSGFESVDPEGFVDLRQVSTHRFRVLTSFRFGDERIVDRWRRRLARRGVPEEVAAEMVDRARSFDVSGDGDTDLASVPQFMRWFENSYGRHTLAAILHDDLILPEPNRGALGSDAFADRFFRDMLKASGVRRVKRWIMWAAVALRTRHAAGGYRRALLWVWAVLATFGITLLVWSAAAIVTDSGMPFDADPQGALIVAVALPVVASALWGKQFGAGLVAAPAALFVLPPAIVVIIGSAVYWVLETVLRVIPGR